MRPEHRKRGAYLHDFIYYGFNEDEQLLEARLRSGVELIEHDHRFPHRVEIWRNQSAHEGQHNYVVGIQCGNGGCRSASATASNAPPTRNKGANRHLLRAAASCSRSADDEASVIRTTSPLSTATMPR